MPAYRKNIIDDGFNPEFVGEAEFDGILEIPKIKAMDTPVVPSQLIPFSQRHKSADHSEFICFFEHDRLFADVVRNPEKFVDEFKLFNGIITPDNSLYRDSPLLCQLSNTYRNRAIGHFFQSRGIPVIANIRWGDERSFTRNELPEPFAFLGAPQNSIVAIGTYGCTQSTEDKEYFRAGLEAMLEYLAPKKVLVYGPMNNRIFGGLTDRAEYIQYVDWTCRIHGRNYYGNK